MKKKFGDFFPACYHPKMQKEFYGFFFKIKTQKNMLKNLNTSEN